MDHYPEKLFDADPSSEVIREGSDIGFTILGSDQALMQDEIGLPTLEKAIATFSGTSFESRVQASFPIPFPLLSALKLPHLVPRAV